MIDDIPNINLNLKALETSIKMTEKSYFKLAEKEYESMCEYDAIALLLNTNSRTCRAYTIQKWNARNVW